MSLIFNQKVKNLPSFCLLADILDIQQRCIPYILFKLEEIKKERPVLPVSMLLKLLRRE